MKIRAPTLADVEAARVRIAGTAHHTPLIPFGSPGEPTDVHVKLECLQPTGAFKIRGALNAVELAGHEALATGVYTGSAGNMAQGLAYAARVRGVPCRVIVPDSAPATKLRAIERLGAEILAVPYDVWWSVLENHGYPGEAGYFIHPVADTGVIAGNGTVGLELLDDLPDLAAVVVPFGGGGQACGIATAVKALRPDVRVFAAEVETAAPLRASLDLGRPTSIDRRPSFVDGIGGSSVLDSMWPMVSTLLDGSIVVSLAQVREAIRMLARDVHVVAEGAGAGAPAGAPPPGGGLGAGAAARGGALTGEAGPGPVVAVISGGNIDAPVLAEILNSPW